MFSTADLGIADNGRTPVTAEASICGKVIVISLSPLKLAFPGAAFSPAFTLIILAVSSFLALVATPCKLPMRLPSSACPKVTLSLKCIGPVTTCFFVLSKSNFFLSKTDNAFGVDAVTPVAASKVSSIVSERRTSPYTVEVASGAS